MVVSFNSWPRLVTTGVTTPYKNSCFNLYEKQLDYFWTHEYRIDGLVRRQRLNHTRNRLQNLALLARLQPTH